MAWLEGRFGIGPYRSFRVRLLVQVSFAAASVLLGFQFARFVEAATLRAEALPPRPPGVEAYLPISGLMGLVDWVYQGTLNTIHPAATLLLLMFVGISLAFRRAFCSWICPVGLLSESLARLGQWLWGRTLRPPRWIDIPLRGLRYLLLGFFLWAILTMTPEGLRGFIESPYNRVSDVKMLLFFVKIGSLGLAVLLVLAAASVLVNGAWCRYLCPYGALTGLVALFSPVRIWRDPELCIGCGSCDQVCMGRCPVSSRRSVGSLECTGCLDCLAVCPVKGVLSVGTRRYALTKLGFVCGVVFLFLAGYAGARLSGHWDNEISDREYIERLGEIDGPQYAHPGAS